MKKSALIIFFVSSVCISQNAWINEFHYDNAGSPDVGEFVEVAIQNSADYDLGDFRISFYSSESGSRYGVYHDLSSFDSGDTENNITLYSKFIPGIQNGPNDGIALDYQGTVLHFISYEGTLTGSEGVADGVTSEDVGISESNSTPAGSSIGLTGSGTDVSAFSWQTLSDDSPGSANNSQVLPVELTSFNASISNGLIRLDWVTVTEINNYGFEIERALLPTGIGENFSKNARHSYKKNNREWENIGFVEGYGNSNSPKYYSFEDDKIIESGIYFYRLKQIDLDGNYEFTEIIEIQFGKPEMFELNQNYPNPFNPFTIIPFSVSHEGPVKINIYNILGELIATPISKKLNPGNYNYEFDGSALISGTYFYELKTDFYRQVRKMMLVK